MKRNASTMESQPAAVETPSPHPASVPQIPSNLIITVLPPDPLKMIFRALPASNLFVAPVCRRFRDLYGAAIQAYLETENGWYNTREDAASMIGAGCGRTDW